MSDNEMLSLRFTKDAGGWICPDAYDFDKPEEKDKLSEILLKNGFAKNEKVSLVIDESKKQIDIVKA